MISSQHVILYILGSKHYKLPMANVALYKWFNGVFFVLFLADGTPQCFVMNVMFKTVHLD